MTCNMFVGLPYVHEKVIVNDEPATPPVRVTGHAEGVRVKNPQRAVGQSLERAQLRPFVHVRVVKAIFVKRKDHVQDSAGCKAEPGGKSAGRKVSSEFARSCLPIDRNNARHELIPIDFSSVCSH